MFSGLRQRDHVNIAAPGPTLERQRRFQRGAGTIHTLGLRIFENPPTAPRSAPSFPRQGNISRFGGRRA
jgi:hypothetical protein